MKTGLGNWSRNFFPRLHREGLNSNEKRRKNKKNKKERKKKREQKFISLLNSNVKQPRVVCSYERKKRKKKGERKKKKKEKVLQRNEDETSKVPFSVAFCLKALFSPAENTHKCVSPLLVGKARFYLGAIAERRSDDILVSFRNEIVENFILEEISRFLSSKISLTLSNKFHSEDLEDLYPKDNWLIAKLEELYFYR